MKKAFLMASFCMGLFISANAQMQNTSASTTNATIDDYEKWLTAHNKVAFRTYVINNLKLTEQQIKDFDPMYADYMKAKNEIANKKTKLINEYKEEMTENDSPDNKENDKEEFLEDYLELQVAESKLRKETFDRMEDKITADNAFGFLLLEDMVANDYYKNTLQQMFTPYVVITEVTPTPSAPAVTTIPKNTTTTTTPTTPKPSMTSNKGVDRKYRMDIDAYSNWVRTNNQTVKDPHHYTRDGLKSLVSAIGALGMTCSTTNNSMYETNKSKIMQNCEKLGVNPSSNEHPDIMRESFIMAADMLKSVQQKCNYTASSNAVMQVSEAAKKIDVNKTSMAQADVIKDFFKKAQIAIDDMANDISWSSN